jgi:hypothetical protein
LARTKKADALSESKWSDKERFLALARRLAKAVSLTERKHVKKELARITFEGARSGLSKGSKGR